MGRKKIITVKKCVTCGKEFETGRHREKINCSKECFKKYQEAHKEERLDKSKKGVIEKYNVDHISKIDGFSQKVKDAKKIKYGDENFNNREKAKKTMIENTGVDNSMRLESTKNKSKKSKKEKYGDENYNNRKKAEETTLKKTGKRHHLQTKESMNKLMETNKELYGTEFTINIEKSRENLKKLNLQKYGSEYYFSSDSFLTGAMEKKKEKIKEMLEKNNISFDIDEYKKLRNKSDKIKYLKYEVECKKCGNRFKTTLVNKPIVCRYCYPIKNQLQ